MRARARAGLYLCTSRYEVFGKSSNRETSTFRLDVSRSCAAQRGETVHTAEKKLRGEREREKIGGGKRGTDRLQPTPFSRRLSRKRKGRRSRELFFAFAHILFGNSLGRIHTCFSLSSRAHVRICSCSALAILNFRSLENRFCRRNETTLDRVNLCRE